MTTFLEEKVPRQQRGEARVSGFLVTVSGQGHFSAGQSHGRALGLGSAPVFLAS